jgi:triphosphatase
MSETELKFLFDEAMTRTLWTRVKSLGLAAGTPRTSTLKSTYLDTADHALKRAGIALRLRRDGRRWVQTVKSGRQLHGGLSQVGEVENPAPGGRLCLHAIPDESVREEVLRTVNGADLQPVCETVIKRRATELALKDDGTNAELSVDIGEIRAGGHSAPICEIEIELRRGSPKGLYDIAQALLPDGGLRFSRLSKSARGYLLATEGCIERPLAPRNAEAVPLGRDLIAEQAARAMLRECLDQIATNMTVVRGLDDAEGPHQLRVGLRRLRSVFSVYKAVLKSPELERIGDEAQWMGQEVGRLRDIDVVGHDIVRREAELHQDEPGLDALATALWGRGVGMRNTLGGLLVGARAQKFLIDLARFVETRGWLVAEDFDQTMRLAQPVGDLADESLGRLWKKVCKSAKGLETLDVHERHALRKDLKKLRYAIDFFGAIYPAKRVDPFLRRVKKLQEVFGDLNDAATVRAMLTSADAPLAGDVAGQRAIGWAIGATQARAEFGWANAKALWQRLEETRPFWK